MPAPAAAGYHAGWRRAGQCGLSMRRRNLYTVALPPDNLTAALETGQIRVAGNLELDRDFAANF